MPGRPKDLNIVYLQILTHINSSENNARKGKRTFNKH